MKALREGAKRISGVQPRVKTRTVVTTSASPWERGLEGNEDVAAPFEAGGSIKMRSYRRQLAR